MDVFKDLRSGTQENSGKRRFVLSNLRSGKKIGETFDIKLS